MDSHKVLPQYLKFSTILSALFTPALLGGILILKGQITVTSLGYRKVATHFQHIFFEWPAKQLTYWPKWLCWNFVKLLELWFGFLPRTFTAFSPNFDISSIDCSGASFKTSSSHFEMFYLQYKQPNILVLEHFPSTSFTKLRSAQTIGITLKHLFLSFNVTSKPSINRFLTSV